VESLIGTETVSLKVLAGTETVLVMVLPVQKLYRLGTETVSVDFFYVRASSFLPTSFWFPRAFS